MKSKTKFSLSAFAFLMAFAACHKKIQPSLEAPPQQSVEAPEVKKPVAVRKIEFGAKA